MMRRAPGITLGLLLLAAISLSQAWGQVEATSMHAAADGTAPPAARHVSFAFERLGVPVPKYVLTVNADGSGRYAGNEAAEVGRGGAPQPAQQPFNREFTVSAATVARLLTLTQELHEFNLTCASKAKNIADTGTKTLTYAGLDGSGSCTYNYSDNKDVQAVTEIFQGLAETMDQGRRLDTLHRFDRLGLDAAITFLAQEVTEGHALEVGTIAATLHSIAADSEVMQRVRTRATSLLALIPVDLRQSGP
jgi:hypothetical protein